MLAIESVAIAVAAVATRDVRDPFRVQLPVGTAGVRLLGVPVALAAGNLLQFVVRGFRVGVAGDA